MNFRFFMKVFPRLSISKSLYYSYKFKGAFLVGRGCSINVHRKGRVVFDNSSSSVYVGVHFSAVSGATLDVYEGGLLRVGKSVGIHRGTKVVVRERAELSIGSRSFINENSRVVCRKNISIGEGCSIAWGVTVSDTDSHGIYVDGQLSNEDAAIAVGDKVWVCAHSIIAKGAILEDNCIVGANSVVLAETLRSGFVYAGNPVKPVKCFDSWGGFDL